MCLTKLVKKIYLLDKICEKKSNFIWFDKICKKNEILYGLKKFVKKKENFILFDKFLSKKRNFSQNSHCLTVIYGMQFSIQMMLE